VFRHAARRAGGCSGCLVVFVDEAAEEVSAHDPAAGHGWLVCIEGRSQLQTTVGPDRVVVLHVHGQDPLQVAWPGEQDPVQALGPDGADPPLGERIGQRRRLHLVESIGVIGIGGCG